jgi:hypothetical protein
VPTKPASFVQKMIGAKSLKFTTFEYKSITSFGGGLAKFLALAYSYSMLMFWPLARLVFLLKKITRKRSPIDQVTPYDEDKLYLISPEIDSLNYRYANQEVGFYSNTNLSIGFLYLGGGLKRLSYINFRRFDFLTLWAILVDVVCRSLFDETNTVEFNFEKNQFSSFKLATALAGFIYRGERARPLFFYSSNRDLHKKASAKSSFLNLAHVNFI